MWWWWWWWWWLMGNGVTFALLLSNLPLPALLSLSPDSYSSPRQSKTRALQTPDLGEEALPPPRTPWEQQYKWPYPFKNGQYNPPSNPAARLLPAVPKLLLPRVLAATFEGNRLGQCQVAPYCLLQLNRCPRLSLVGRINVSVATDSDKRVLQ